ncbi:MAG: sulfatase-like hydrolase/transferase, partial [Planctomycetaceae bacterium]|nr:sulfatase-like hydrolase/transferase [Planctomycetaceae bacterium]
MTRILAGVLLAISFLFSAVQGADTKRPNIVLIMADDLGYNELGSYGQKLIQTPYLDTLATQGMKFSRNYCGNAVCAPSRCVLMTG